MAGLTEAAALARHVAQACGGPEVVHHVEHRFAGGNDGGHGVEREKSLRGPSYDYGVGLLHEWVEVEIHTKQTGGNLEQIAAFHPSQPQLQPLAQKCHKPAPAVDRHHRRVGAVGAPGARHNHAGVVSEGTQRIGEPPCDDCSASEVVIGRQYGYFHK